LLLLGTLRGTATDSVMVAGSGAASHRCAGNRCERSGTLVSMTRPASVTGCMSCGALYSPTAGDQGLCGPCSSVLASEPAPQAQASPAAAPAQRSRALPKRPAVVSALRPSFRSRRALRHIAVATAGALLVVSGAAMVMPRRSRSEAWGAVQRGSYSNAWISVRRHGLPGAWASIRHHASDAWVALRSQIRFGAPNRPAQPGKGAAKRKDGMNTLSSTP